MGMDMIASACAEANLDADMVEQLTLVVVSDMAFSSQDSMHRVAQQVWHDAGLRTGQQTPYPCPHIVYWSLHPDQAIVPASMVYEQRCTLLSGYSPEMLNAVCSSGPSEIGQGMCSPTDGLRRALAKNKRYAWAWPAASKVSRPNSRSGWW